MVRIALSYIGCKVNNCEIETLGQLFTKAGYQVVPYSDIADIYVLNTCTVTSTADAKSRQLLRRPKKNNPRAIIVGIGCLTQRLIDNEEELPGVDFLLGQIKDHEFVDFVEKNLAPGIEAIEGKHPTREKYYQKQGPSKTRAFLKIQDGCNCNCAYCIIPSVRKNSRSMPFDQIINQVENLVENGYREIVLAGIHLGLYGRDHLDNTGLSDVIAKISDFNEILRIRLGSLEPSDFSTDLIDAFGQYPKLCAHVHVPLQSGSNAILARMRRPYTVEEYIALINELSSVRPGLAISTDIIAGLPGETEGDHLLTNSLLTEIDFSRVHVFPYSSRPGTDAAKMNLQVNEQIKRRRMDDLLKKGKFLKNRHAENQTGKIIKVLIECLQKDQHGKYYYGHADDYTEVRVYNDSVIGIGCEVNLLATRARDGYIIGSLL
jgi:threonylcarbamoyladenosine tRNA methylthiotransferase MtaB